MISSFLSCSVCLRLFVGKLQEDKAKCEEYRKRCNRDIDRTACQLDGRNDGRAKEACAFAEDIIDAEVFTGVFRRNDLGKVTSRQGLNRSLETADTKRKNPKVNQCM